MAQLTRSKYVARRSRSTRAAKLWLVLSSRPAPLADARDSSVVGADSLFLSLAFGALLLLLLLGPYELSGFWPSTYDFWPQALFLSLAGAGALLLALSPESRPRMDATAMLLLAFLGWNVLASLTSVYKHDSWLEVARLSGPIAVFFAVRVLYRRDRAVWIVGAWCLGMAFVCLPALLDFGQTRFSRQTGTFYNANLFANALAMTLPVALVFPVLVRRRFGGVAFALAALPFFICALGLVVTSSKGGFVAALLALLLTVALVLRAKKSAVKTVLSRHRLAFAGGALVLGLLFTVVASKTILPRLQQARGSDDNSTMFRVYTWKGTLKMAEAAPILGHGPASFPNAYPRYAQAGYTRSAHQSWLQIAAESGFVGLLLILGAQVAALKKGLRQGRSQDWPLVAGMTGAVLALLIHGCFDAGWSATSILILLAVALAILSSLDGEAGPQPESAAPQSRLSPFWLMATLLLALGGYQTQKAASGEDARDRATEYLQKGPRSSALQTATEATTTDPGAARLWSYLGRVQVEMGGDGQASFATAAKLQPTRAANWANLARDAESHGAPPAEIEKLYERAVECDPLDTNLRLERANWLLSQKNSQGAADLEKIIQLRSEPYGRYPALAEWINLDYARATVQLAHILAKKGQKARAQSLVKLGLADCDQARKYQAGNEAVLRESGGETALDANEDIETVAAQLRALQTELK